MNSKKTFLLPFILVTTLLLLAGCVGKPVQPNPTATLTVRSPSNTPTETLLPIVISTNTPLATATPALGIGSTMTGIDGMTLIYVPQGPFTMGSDEDADAENPAHTVTMEAFWMDQTEVTNSMFQAFVQSNNYQTEAERIGKAYFLDLNSKSWWRMEGVDWQHPQGPGSSLTGLSAYPVVEVSWNDASAYCAWAGGRLPSEAEWEKAARGTDGRTYPWGDAAPNGNLLNFADVNLDVSWADKGIDDSNQLTASVDSYPDGASPYGALNMAGNVWEWVSDWYDVYPGGDKSASSDFGITYRVLRGGSWDYQNSYARSAYRLRGTPYDAGGNIGFRCARSQEFIPSVTATAETNSLLTPLSPTVFTCPLAPKPRVNVGDMARISFTTGKTTRLRSAPESGDNLVEMLSEGTELKIIGGPVCYPRPGRNDAYMYWKVFVSSNSKEGWVAEGDFDSYYIEPLTTLGSAKIYFSVNGNLFRMNLDGSDHEIVSNIGLGERFSIDSPHNKLYVSRWDKQSQILILDLQSEDETFVDGPGAGGQGLVIDPITSTTFLGLYYQGVYVTDMDNAGGWTQLVDSASISPMLGQRGQLQINSANRHVYFRSAFNGDCGICRYIWRVDFNGNNLTKIIPANGGDALALDLTKGKMYFSDVPGHGTIMRANLDGSAAEVVFTIPGPYHYCWTIVLDVPHKKMYMMLFDETKDFKEKAIARSNLDGTEFEILYEKTENTPEEASGDMDLYLP